MRECNLRKKYFLTPDVVNHEKQVKYAEIYVGFQRHCTFHLRDNDLGYDYQSEKLGEKPNCFAPEKPFRCFLLPILMLRNLQTEKQKQYMWNIPKSCCLTGV